MIVLLDTSTPVCFISLVDGDWRYDDQWQAGRGLAKGLLGYIQTQLQQHDASWADITGIGVFQGPGSFTGLRIGLTAMNTIADAQQIPIIGSQGSDWQTNALARLRAGDNDRLVMPFYGGEAHITTPRK